MHVLFLMYEGVEPVDLAAIGVISMAKRVIPEVSYEAIAVTEEAVRFSNGLMVLPSRRLDQVRSADVVVVPGGPGWKAASHEPRILDFLRRVAPSSLICSVCTGAMILAETGLLDGRDATTKVEVVDPERSPLAELAERHPNIGAHRALVVDAGTVVTGGGVTLCIDAILHLLEKRFGPALTDEVARIMEYGAARQANRARFPERSVVA